MPETTSSVTTQSQPRKSNRQTGHAARFRPRSPAAQPPDGGLLDDANVELIGIVIERSRELGLGNDLFDSHVAKLSREGRAALWESLAPVVDITLGYGAPDGRPGNVTTHPQLQALGVQLHRVCERVGCHTKIASAFLLTADEWQDNYGPVGGARRVHAAINLDAENHLDRIRKASPRAHRAVLDMLRVVAQELCSDAEVG